MQSIIDFVQHNPIAVFFMTILGFISTVFSLVQGYEQYVKGVRVPLWLALLAIVIVFVFALLSSSKNDELRLMRGINYGIESVVMDGKRFENCTFEGTNFVVRGEKPFQLSECRIGKFYITVDGPASTTLDMLTVMYKEPGFRPIIERTFEGIRKGERIVRKISSPPNS